MYDWNGNGKGDPGDYVFDQMYQDEGLANSGTGSGRSTGGQKSVSWLLCLGVACVIELVGCLVLIGLGFDIAEADLASLIILFVLTVIIKCSADSGNYKGQK